MTAIDFIGAGVLFTVDGVVGPAGRGDILEQLRAEVARRVGSMTGSELPIRVRGYGQCETCSDAIPAHRSGMCELCCLARRKALVSLGRLSPVVAPPPVPRRRLRVPNLEAA